MFQKYQHIERFGTAEVEGIELGICYIFPKIDGTNGSLWVEDGELCAGSRNRQLYLDNDNADFFAEMSKRDNIRQFFHQYPRVRLFGEWLVPHSLKTYTKDAWHEFYVFDVMIGDEYLNYEDYKPMLDSYNIKMIPIIAKIKNTNYDQLIGQLEKNTFLIEDGKGVGEGIVIKQYGYKNKYGRTIWAKMVTNTFKTKHSEVMGGDLMKGKKMVEEEIVGKYLTEEMIKKVYANLSIDGWSTKKIPQLLQTCFYDLIKEESWNFIKKFKNPTVNFKTLNSLSIIKIKETLPELF